MAEVVGIISGIIAILQGISSGVNIVNELYKAPKEIQTLHDQVLSFRSVLETIPQTPKQLTNPAITTTLHTAQELSGELLQLLTGKLLDHKAGSHRGRRRAWLRYRSRVTFLRDKLNEARETLAIALNVNSMITSNRVELSLLAITRQTTASQSVFDIRRINDFQGLSAFDSHILVDKSSHKVVELSVDTVPDNTCDENSQRNEPASPFELSSSFFPESYTTMEIPPKLVVYKTYEHCTTEYTRVNCYESFYCAAPRRWIRVSISVTVSVDSPLWGFTKVAYLSGPWSNTPAGLMKTWKNFLASSPKLEQDSHLSVYLGEQGDRDVDAKNPKMSLQIRKPRSEIMERLKTITVMANHWNCPRYFEKDIVQQPQHMLFHDDRFISFLESRWVLTYRFGPDEKRFEERLYLLKALQCLRGAPSVNPFVGTLLDQQGVISGFMTEFPLRGHLAALLANSAKLGRPVEWERREKWCKQIVQAVAMAHSRMFTIGTLAESKNFGIYIDGWDNAVLCHFQECFNYDRTRTGMIPPEQRHLAHSSGSMKASLESDIYQLGLIIWMIARHPSHLTRSHFCRTFGCMINPHFECTEPHADPVQLPIPCEDCPEYLYQIISCCRRENPTKRLPAWKLLELFEPTKGALPSSSKMEENKIKINKDTNTSSPNDKQSISPGKLAIRPEDCKERSVRCDVCKAPTLSHFFHCNICLIADYDICPRCFDRGVHCYDESHYLCEYFYNNEGQTKYYTSVKNSGRRDILEF